MAFPSDLLGKISGPFLYPLLPYQRFYWLYLASALALALAVHAVGRGSRVRGTVRDALEFCFPGSIYGHGSALVDYKFFIVNRISFAIAFAPLIVGAPVIARLTVEALHGIYGTWGLGRVPSPGVDALFTLALILAFDGAVFAAHYLQHKVPVLWEFHKVHHSAEVLTPVTVYRTHPVDDLLTGSLIGVVTGIVQGVFGFVFSFGVREILVNDLNVALFLF